MHERTAGKSDGNLIVRALMLLLRSREFRTAPCDKDIRCPPPALGTRVRSSYAFRTPRECDNKQCFQDTQLYRTQSTWYRGNLVLPPILRCSLHLAYLALKSVHSDDAKTPCPHHRLDGSILNEWCSRR